MPKTYDLPPLCAGYPEYIHTPRRMVKAGFQDQGVGANRHPVQVYKCLHEHCGRRTTKNNGGSK